MRFGTTLGVLVFTWACSGQGEQAEDEHAEHALPNDEHEEHAESSAGAHAGHGAGGHADHAPLAAVDAPNELSLHDLPTTLRDPEGAELTFEDFAGHPTLVAMFYGSCTTVCPLIIGDLVRADESAEDPRVRLALITLDPERDSAERLRALRDARHLDAARWKFLRTTEEGVRDVAAALGVQYRRLADGEYAHSALIVLLDGEGRPVWRHEGVGQPLDRLLAELRSLLGSSS